MPATNCPYCNRLVTDASRLESHYGRTSCREADKKFREGIASEDSSDGEQNPRQPLSARETATIAAPAAGPSRRDGDRREKVPMHSMPRHISPSEKELLEFIDKALTDDDIAADSMQQHTSPSEQELLELIDEVLTNNDPPAHLDYDEEMGNIEVEVGNEPAEPIPPAAQRRSHGYATIEVHPNAARVYRWCFEDEQPGGPVKRDELHDKKIFEIAKWLMKAQVSNTKRAEFLNFELNREHYPYRNPSKMLKSIDGMEHGPEWQEFTLTVSTTEGSETFVIYWRNPIDIIAYLIRQKRFQDHMNFGPERHWTITLDGRKIRVYSEMWTGDWWWRLQRWTNAQWTGNEARAIAKSFLGVVASDSPEMGVEAARALMDFTFRARQPQLDEDDLARLDHDLREFHATREVFLTRGAYKGEDFNHFAKMHMMGHYTHQIREWGAPDGYNTEGPERLHIEYVKIPYGTTSGVEPEGQMIRYLQRIEALCIRRAELERAGVIEPRKRRYRPDDDMSGFEASEGDESEDELDVMMGDWEGQGAGKAREQSAYQPEPAVSIAKEPTLPIVPASTIIETYRAPGFLEAVRLHLETQNCNLAYIISDEPTFGVYHKITLVHPPLPFAPLGGPRNELVRASPARYNAHGLVRRSAFFDTVLIESNHCASGLQRYCPARVLVIFQLPRHLLKQYSQVMAYVELFDEFAPNIPEQHGLPITEPLRHNGQPVRLVIPVTDLRLACHLLPDYASLRQRFPDSRWDSSTDMLSFAHRFFLNRHVNYYFFALMDHWRRIDNHQRIQTGVAQ
ncbi:hypothetical protein RSOL_355980, partial [Rhizoctonia solani AG-3 Rhs1AP]